MIIDYLRGLYYKAKFGERLWGTSFVVGKCAKIKVSKDGKLELGKALLNDNSFICVSDSGMISIGDNVTVNRNSIIVSKKRIIIGSGTSIGPNVCIYDHDHRITAEGFIKNEYTVEDVVIGRNVWIGANAVILKGSIIGDNCIIGAGTVIKGKIADNNTVYVKSNFIYRKNDRIE